MILTRSLSFNNALLTKKKTTWHKEVYQVTDDAIWGNDPVVDSFFPDEPCIHNRIALRRVLRINWAHFENERIEASRAENDKAPSSTEDKMSSPVLIVDVPSENTDE